MNTEQAMSRLESLNKKNKNLSKRLISHINSAVQTGLFTEYLDTKGFDSLNNFLVHRGLMSEFEILRAITEKIPESKSIETCNLTLLLINFFESYSNCREGCPDIALYGNFYKAIDTIADPNEIMDIAMKDLSALSGMWKYMTDPAEGFGSFEQRKNENMHLFRVKDDIKWVELKEKLDSGIAYKITPINISDLSLPMYLITRNIIESKLENTPIQILLAVYIQHCLYSGKTITFEYNDYCFDCNLVNNWSIVTSKPLSGYINEYNKLYVNIRPD